MDFKDRLRGIHGLEAIEFTALPLIGELIGRLDTRVSALELGAAKQISINNNEDIKRDLVDADNAIEKALNHFRTTAEENRYGK